MRIFLAATSDKQFIPNICDSMYILESFYYFQEWQIPMIKKCKMFLLDSGAFTFMYHQDKEVDFEKYLDAYIKFIVKNDVKYFFELDVDAVVGYDQVLKFRKTLEEKTGRKCIPVWHKNRGLDEYKATCREYSYVSLGGLTQQGNYRKEDYKYFSWFIDTAHKNDCQIHALGFTALNELKKYHFDSVDSTSWKSGGRFGQLHIYKNGTIETYSDKTRRAIYKNIDKHNFNEWLKFQRYADERL